MTDKKYTLGIDIGSTTVKIAILDEENQLLFADYERHFANIQETLAHLLGEAHEKLGELTLQPVITGSGGLALANHLGIPFTQEVIAVSTSLKALAPQTQLFHAVLKAPLLHRLRRFIRPTAHQYFFLPEHCRSLRGCFSG